MLKRRLHVLLHLRIQRQSPLGKLLFYLDFGEEALGEVVAGRWFGILVLLNG